MRLSRRSAATLGSVALLLFSQRGAAQAAYVAATSQTIVSRTVEQEGSFAGHSIYIENHSTVPVTVFSVNLSGCENVKQSCSTHRTNIHLGPGGRELAIRVNASDRDRAMSYRFGFSWHPDSAVARALGVLAEGGDESARDRLAAMQHRDSMERAERGTHYNELSREDFSTLGSRAVALHVVPDSLVLTPGQRYSLDQVRVLVVDSQGVALGATRWIGRGLHGSSAFQLIPPNDIVARAPGRFTVRYRLAEAAATQLGHELAEVELPIVVAYASNPHAPSFSGVAVDGDSKTPLGCTDVVLEDSAQNVVAAGRTDRAGAFTLRAPRAGTYRVRVEAPGWAPVYGESEGARDDEVRRHQYEIRFSDQLLRARPPMDPDVFQDAHPIAISFAPTTAGGPRVKPSASAAPVQRVSLGGTPTSPILGIVSRAPTGSMMSQFVVDSAGRIDPATVQLAAGTDRIDAATLQSVLPRVRFAPARANGKPTCELLRMQIDFTRP